MTVTIESYSDTGNPKICFDGLPVTANYCHLPRSCTALNTQEFPEALDCLTALDVCEDTTNIVKCNAGVFPVVTVKFTKDSIEI